MAGISNGTNRFIHYTSGVTIYMNRAGFSLLSLLLGVAASSLLILSVSKFMGVIQRLWVQTDLKIETEDGAISLVQSIMQHGRIARVCNKGTPPVNLTCSIDKNRPPTTEGNALQLTTVRWEWNAASKMVHQKEYDTPNVLARERIFKGIYAFTVCNSSNMMQGLCAIAPSQIKSASNRFFRFRIQGVSGNTPYQGAFYVRHPTPFFSNVLYQWGSR